MKKFLIVANWKLNGSIKMISSFFEYLKMNLSTYAKKNTIVIAPPNVYLDRIQKYISNINILLASQNVDINIKGAFTGESSVLMLQDIGVKYIIIGHSERRLFHHETNDIIEKKFHLIQEFNLTPILCIGETAIEKKNGETKKVIEEQLNCILKNLKQLQFKKIVIAYEPIWAIGTGLSANPKDVQCTHEFIKNYIIKKYNSINIKNVTVQYGGSVNYTNAQDFLEQSDIDGLLIGNASLNPEEFLKIIKIANNIA